MKLSRPNLKPRTVAAGGSLIMAVLFLICGREFWQLEQHRQESRKWVHHSHEVMNEVHNLSAKLKDLELGERGYLLTGDEKFLAPYKTALGSEISSGDAVLLGTFDARPINNVMEHMRSLVADNPRQLQSVDWLTQLVGLKLERVENVLRLRDVSSYMATRAMTTPESQTALAELQVTMATILNREKLLLAIREQRDAAADRSFTLFTVSMLAGAFVTLVLTLLVLWRNFDKKLATENALLEKERQFRSVVTHGTDAYFLFQARHRDGKVAKLKLTFLNQQAQEILGELEFPNGKPSIGELRRLFSHQADNFGTDLELFVHQQFHQSEARLNGGPLAGRDFQEQIVAMPNGIAISYRDITERKQVDLMKSEFISTVSHELRTPLTSIRGSLGLITAGAVGLVPEASLSLIKIAHNNCERLVRLINDILDIERIESGKMNLSLRPLPLAATIHAAIEQNKDFAAKFGIKLLLKAETDDDPEAIIVRADGDRVIQVLTNLISNAVKFSEQGNEVVIAFQAKDGVGVVEVRDRGRGIPEKFRNKIFGKFNQADAGDARDKGGTGLGLSIVKATIEAMDGKVGYSSELGHGSIFHFTLPLIDATIRALPVQNLADVSVSAAGARILVCEDEPDIAMLLRMILEREGFAVDVAENASEAIAALNCREYAGMTLDLVLPDKCGVAVIRELRASLKFRDLPIVVVSAKAEAGRRLLKAGAIGVLDWMTKPIEPARIAAIVHSMAKKGRPARVLHVEDDADIIGLLEMALGEAAQVTRALTLAQAKERLEQGGFDVVILDIGLPDGNGIELLPLLGPAGKGIPVVLYTASEIPEDLGRLVAGSLVKSRASEQELTRMIHQLLARDRGSSTRASA